MKRVFLLVPLFLAACSGGPQEYTDTRIPEPKDFREIVVSDAASEVSPDTPTGSQFVSANGEVCQVTGADTAPTAVCADGNGNQKVAANIISGSY